MTDNTLRQVPASSQEQKLFITSLHLVLFTSVCHLSAKHGWGTVMFWWAQLSEKNHKLFCPLKRLFSKGLLLTVSFHFLHFALTLPYSDQASSPEFYFRAPAQLQSIEADLTSRDYSKGGASFLETKIPLNRTSRQVFSFATLQQQVEKLTY